MLLSEHLEGRIQCVNEDFVCINLHFNSRVDKKHSFIDQIYLNKSTGNWILPNFIVVINDNYFNDSSLQKEMQVIIDQYYDARKQLDLRK